MDPKGIAKFGVFEDNQPAQGQFRRMVVFNDGTKGWEIYEYGTDGPVATVPDKNLPGDPKQAADWVDYQKKVTPVRTDIAYDANGVAVKTETPEGGTARVVGTEAPKPAPATASAPPHEEKDPANPDRMRRWNPTTKSWEDAGPIVKPDATASAEAKAPLEGHPGIFTVQRKTKEGNNETSTTVFVDASGAEVPDPRGPQATKAVNKEPVPGFPGVYIVKAGSKDAQGNTVSDTYYVDEAGNRVQQPKKPDPPTMINGKPYRLTADGRYEPVPVGGTGTQAPDISSTNAELGQVADSLRSKAAQLAERVRSTAGSENPYTIEDYKRDLTTERELAQAKVTELTSIGQEQRGVQQGERTEGASRRSYADQVVKNAHALIGGPDTRVLGPQAGEHYVGALREMMNMQKTFAESIPGTFPDVSRTPLQKSIMSMGPDGKITIDPSALSGAGAGAPGGIQTPDLNSIGAQFGASGGVPRDPTGVFMPPGSGQHMAGVGGGLVTAPGFSEGQTPPPFQYDPMDGEEPLGAGTGFEDAIGSTWQSFGA